MIRLALITVRVTVERCKITIVYHINIYIHENTKCRKHYLLIIKMFTFLLVNFYKISETFYLVTFKPYLLIYPLRDIYHGL